MRFVLAAALLALAAAPAGAADPRQDLVDGLSRCAAIGDNAARLACYDALNPAMHAAQAGPAPFVPVPAPAGATPPAAATPALPNPNRNYGVPTSEQVKPEQFGSENIAPPPSAPGHEAEAAANNLPPTVDSITSGVADYSFNPYKKFIVILDNGQIWKQIESDSGEAHFMKGEKNTVTISRGFLDSYNLVINDASMSYKVKRLK